MIPKHIHDHAKHRAHFSAHAADRSLPHHVRRRALHHIRFLDKIGTTPPPQNLTPVAMTVGDHLHTPAQTPPRPSLMPDGMQHAPAKEPFPSE